jgi:hypothetical protein
MLAAGALIVVAPNLLPFGSWLRSNQPTQGQDVGWAQYGLRLKAATSPPATIAASAVGNIGYFSERPVVDLLGKTDPIIARRPAHTSVLMVPGHWRWDYQYSIVTLQPDVIAQLFLPTQGDIAMIESAGYRRVPTSNRGAMTYTRAGDSRVNDLIKRAAAVARW